jgi:hypothetical protein
MISVKNYIIHTKDVVTKTASDDSLAVLITDILPI